MSGTKHLDKKNVRAVLGLSPMQAAMLFHYLAAPGSDLHVEQVCLVLNGDVDETFFKRAWDKVVQANEALRTVFRWEGIKQPVQIVLNEHQPDLRCLDFAGKPGDREAALDIVERLKVQDRQEKFDLSVSPFRVSLAGLGHGQTAMLVSYHHILMDGWSLGIVLKEFFYCYGELRQGKEPILAGKPSYKDFLDLLARQGHEPGAAEIGPGARAAGKAGGAGVFIDDFGRYHAGRSPEFSKKLQDFCRAKSLTPAAVLHTAWALVIMGYNRSGKAGFFATVSGRQAKVKGIGEMVGLLIDTRALTVGPKAGRAVVELAFEVNEMLANPAEVVPGPMEKNLFDTLFILENYPLTGVLGELAGDWSIESAWFSILSAYEVTVMVTLYDGLEVHLVADKERWTEEMAAGLVEVFLEVVEAVMAQPGRVVEDLSGELAVRLANGRERLEAMAAVSTAANRGYPQPRDEVEERLQGMFSEVLRLGREQIGIDDDFFVFKGHSLRASMLAFRVQREFGVRVPVGEIFRRPTIRLLGEWVRSASKEEFRVIEAVEKREYYPVTSAQRRFYGLQGLDESSAAYHVVSAMVIGGEIEQSRFKGAFQGLLERHESLRTWFTVVDGEPVQRVLDRVDFELEVYEIGGRSGRDGHSGQELIETIIQGFIRPFDLSRAPLLRVGLVGLANEEYLWLVDMHHIITDGVSAGLLIKDFIRLYQGDEPGPVRVQYKDFACFQAQAIGAGALSREREYWLGELSGELPVLSLATDFPRPAVQGFAGDRLRLELDKSLTDRLAEKLVQTQTTLFVFLLSAINVLFSRVTGQEDIIIGTTIAGRSRADLEDTVGLFIETLALRNYPVTDKVWEAFLSEVRQRVLSAFAHESYPFRELMRDLGLDGEKGKNPLFNVMLIVQNVEKEEMRIEGLGFRPFAYRPQAAKVDITIEVFEEGDKVALELEYCTDLFKRTSIERLGEGLVEVLGQVVGDENPQLKDIRVCGLGEARLVVEEYSRSVWDGGGHGFGLGQVQELFKKQAEGNPGRIALVQGGEHMSYQELSERARRLAGLLRRI